MAGALGLAGIRAGQDPSRLRPPPRAAGPEERRPAVGIDGGRGAGPGGWVDPWRHAPRRRRRREGRAAPRGPRALRDRGGRCIVSVRAAGGCEARRVAAARHRGSPVLPERPSPHCLAGIVARPLGGRRAAARIRLGVPATGRIAQRRRRPAQHVHRIQGRLGAALVRRVRPDDRRGVGPLGGDRRGARALGFASDGDEPPAARDAGAPADR